MHAPWTFALIQPQIQVLPHELIEAPRTEPLVLLPRTERRAPHAEYFRHHHGGWALGREQLDEALGLDLVLTQFSLE